MRKKVGDSLSLSAGYYEDMISSASIDVKLVGEPLSRDPQAGKRRRSTTSTARPPTASATSTAVSRTTIADTTFYSVSQDMFGDLTTLTMGYKRAWDNVDRDECNPLLPAHPIGTECPQIINDPSFHERAGHRGLFAVLEPDPDPQPDSRPELRAPD